MEADASLGGLLAADGWPANYRGGHRYSGDPHAGTLAWIGVPVRARAGCGVLRDTLFQGGPGATGRSYSDFPTIIESIRSRLLTLPPETVVHTGHGDDTAIGAEAPQLEQWLARGS